MKSVTTCTDEIFGRRALVTPLDLLCLLFRPTGKSSWYSGEHTDDGTDRDRRGGECDQIRAHAGRRNGTAKLNSCPSGSTMWK